MESLTNGPKFPLIEETLKRYKPEDCLNQNLELINFDLIDPQDPDREIVQNKVIGKIPESNPPDHGSNSVTRPRPCLSEVLKMG